jgi:hypothetical protein
VRFVEGVRRALEAAAAVLAVTCVVLLVSAAPSWADTSATCTTDTATSYCETVPSGTNGGATVAGFGIGMTVTATVWVALIGLVLLRRGLTWSGQDVN